MKFLSTLTLCAALLSAVALRAQSVSMAVISSTGGFYTDANISVAHTTAEMTMVQTFTSGSIVLTQGFHQPALQNTTSLSDFPKTGFASVQLYPNPAIDYCQINFELPNAAEVTFMLLNSMGQTVLSHAAAPFAEGNHTQALALDACAAGFYIVRLQHSSPNGKTQWQNLPLQIIR